MVRSRHTRVSSRSVLGKRGRGGNYVRAFKRRRTVRKGRKTIAFTSQSGIGRSLGFRSRKLVRRRWNSMLWNTTLQKEHYRSNLAQHFTISATNSPLMNYTVQNALNFANPFWLAAGGAVSTDAVAVPSFDGDIILRGGKIGLLLSNPIADTTSIRVQVMLIRTGLNVDPTITGTTVSVGWDPSLAVDFPSRVGKVIYRKDILLENSSTSEVEYRVKIQKIDQDNFLSNKYTYRWFIMACNPEATGSTSLAITRYYNLSFSADAI